MLLEIGDHERKGRQIWSLTLITRSVRARRLNRQPGREERGRFRASLCRLGDQAHEQRCACTRCSAYSDLAPCAPPPLCSRTRESGWLSILRAEWWARTICMSPSCGSINVGSNHQPRCCCAWVTSPCDAGVLQLVGKLWSDGRDISITSNALGSVGAQPGALFYLGTEIRIFLNSVFLPSANVWTIGSQPGSEKGQRFAYSIHELVAPESERLWAWSSLAHSERQCVVRPNRRAQASDVKSACLRNKFEGLPSFGESIVKGMRTGGDGFNRFLETFGGRHCRVPVIAAAFLAPAGSQVSPEGQSASAFRHLKCSRTSQAPRLLLLSPSAISCADWPCGQALLPMHYHRCDRYR